MNKTTLLIAEKVATKYGPCDLERARNIQDYIENNIGLDMSECSSKDIVNGIDEAVRYGK